MEIAREGNAAKKAKRSQHFDLGEVQKCGNYLLEL